MKRLISLVQWLYMVTTWSIFKGIQTSLVKSWERTLIFLHLNPSVLPAKISERYSKGKEKRLITISKTAITETERSKTHLIIRAAIFYPYTQVISSVQAPGGYEHCPEERIGSLFEIHVENEPGILGFLTNRGIFLTDEEAYHFAIENKQWKDYEDRKEKILKPSDLWSINKDPRFREYNELYLV